MKHGEKFTVRVVEDMGKDRVAIHEDGGAFKATPRVSRWTVRVAFPAPRLLLRSFYIDGDFYAHEASFACESKRDAEFLASVLKQIFEYLES